MTPDALRAGLEALLEPSRVLTHLHERVARASDASFYHLVPRAVVQPRSVEEVRRLFAFAREARLPLVFRGAGTSLSGQAITDGILVDVARHFRGFRVEQGGARVRVQPGALGGRVNAALRPHGRRLGPDPASIDRCTVGGILANNASGMCCGVEENAYRTLERALLLLPDGTLLDTGAKDASTRLGALGEGLLALRRRALATPGLAERIRRRYQRKNTTGYALNALLDFEEPARILEHLVVGSEGTLAFIAEAVLRTVPEPAFRATALLLFPTVQAAGAAVDALARAGARAVEIMDRACLRAVAGRPGVPAGLEGLPEEAAALLVELQAEEPAALEAARAAAARVCAALPLLAPARFTADAGERAALWQVRKGLFPAVGAARRTGTTVLIEDIALPRERLAEAIGDLRALFAAHGYPDGIVFGHARDGNLHFVLTQAFGDAAAVRQYERFMADLVRLVVERYDGALKAEHGTGRNMAPFVETEWGAEAYALMRDVKALLDPDGLLNPGVILTDDPRAHLKHLKPFPTVEPEVDRCIECGFCESVCPTRDATTTPRQRIVVRRELARLRAGGTAPAERAELEAAYAWQAVGSCATDGLCATACPVDIDTGALMKRLRAEGRGRWARRLATLLARRFGWVERALRLGLRLGHAAEGLVGPRLLGALPGLLGPRWSTALPRSAPRQLPADSAAADAEVVYFPSCTSRLLGLPRGADTSLPEVLLELGRRAGVRIVVPAGAAGRCCGLPFGSKGFPEAQATAAAAWVDALWEASREGRLPVVVDASSCTQALRGAGALLTGERRERWQRLTLLDAVELVRERLLPRLQVRPVQARVFLHPSCSARKLGLEGAMLAVARACATHAEVPQALSCCATAGDRGLAHPELPRAALAEEAAELAAGAFDACYSSNVTCEVGLSAATGRPFRSLLRLVEEATRPAVGVSATTLPVKPRERETG